MSSVSSDCESSYYTESEAESDYVTHEEGQPTAQYNHTLEVEDIIREHVDVTTKNAVGLNHQYKAKLLVLRQQLEVLLSRCQHRLLEVEKSLDDIRLNLTPKTRPSRPRHPGYICGQPFFKDSELYPGPHNEDYLYRKNVKKEFFPLDMFEMIDTLWTRTDKQMLRDSVARQAYEFVRRENQLLEKMCLNSGNIRRIIKERIEMKALPLEEIWPKAQAFDGKYGRQKFVVDWLKISNAIMNGRHSAAACEGMWNNYLLPSLKRSIWTPDEESRLVAAVEANGRSNWALIALSVENRSEYQCLVHYQTNFSELSQIKKMPWTQEEDDQLLRLANENRIGNSIIWNKVVERMPYRNKVQVYHRYKYTLLRPLRGAKFAAEEDCVITAYVQQFGDDFKFFPEDLLPGRTTKQVRARYMNTLRFVNTHVGWSLDEDKRLMSYIAEHLTEEGPGKISWAECSKHLGNHSRLSCRTRYYTIERFLERNPNATLESVPRREKKKLSSTVTGKNWIKTIVEIKSAPKLAGKSGTSINPLEVGKSSLAEWSLYEQMKFCFRYKFGNKLAVTTLHNHVYTGTKMLLYLLEGFKGPSSDCMFHPKSEALQMQQAILHSPLDWAHLVSIMHPKVSLTGESMLFCRFPPNFNTVLGLRGVCLNACSEQTKQTFPEQKPKKLGTFNEPMYNQAIAVFVERFRKMFHWTMLLMMLNIDDVSLESEEPARHDNRNDHPTIIVPVKMDTLMNAVSCASHPEQSDTSTMEGNNLNLVTNITIIDPKDLPAVPEYQLRENVPYGGSEFKCQQYLNDKPEPSSKTSKATRRSRTTNKVSKSLGNVQHGVGDHAEQYSSGMVSSTIAVPGGMENGMLQNLPTFTFIKIPQEITLLHQHQNLSTIPGHMTTYASSSVTVKHDDHTNIIYDGHKMSPIVESSRMEGRVIVPLQMSQHQMVSNESVETEVRAKVDEISTSPASASEDIVTIDVDRHASNNSNTCSENQAPECFPQTKQNMLVPYNRIAYEGNCLANNVIDDVNGASGPMDISPHAGNDCQPSGHITLMKPLEMLHQNQDNERGKMEIESVERNEDSAHQLQEGVNVVTGPIPCTKFDSNEELMPDLQEPLTAVDIIRMLRARHNTQYFEDSEENEDEFENVPND
uniref:snRNA-activating protein complex subunit 4 n=1 Tax=Anopheles minimus TaxID=112268 RepID=A0A182VW66_9DIPT